MEATDIVLLESERMSDTSDGGGRMTANVVVDGQINNIFPRVSRVDSVNGRVNLRKVYMAVRTATLEMAGGAHTIVSAPPADEKIAITIFSTNSAFDLRQDARNRIESYIVRGPQSRMVLYGTQWEGQASITVYQRVEEPLPEVATVLCLSLEGSGYTPVEQYVRLADITRNEVRQFTIALGTGEMTFSRRILTLKLDSVLRYDFPGPEQVSPYQNHGSPTLVRETTVQDAARYYGIAALTEAVSAGAFGLKLASIYTRLSPTATRETAVANASPGGARVAAAAGAELVNVRLGNNLFSGTGTHSLWMPGPILPGTLYLSASPIDTPAWGTNSRRIIDNGDGTAHVVDNSGAVNTQISAVQIDYATGRVDCTINSDFGPWYWYVSYTPGLELATAAWTRATTITLATRGTVYVETLNPLPAPGTLRIAYRALGRWYDLADDGAGKIEGADAAFGVGNIDYVTGTLTVTLGALPDVDSALVYTWGTPQELLPGNDADLAIEAPEVVVQLAAGNCEPGTLTITWTGGTASDDGAGNITGNATGRVQYGTGRLAFRPASLPASTAQYQLDYEAGTTQSMAAALAGLPINLALSGPVRQKSLAVTIETLTGDHAGSMTIVDDGAGGLKTSKGAAISGAINYTTGAVTITGLGSATVKKKSWSYLTSAGQPSGVVGVFGGYGSSSETVTPKAGGGLAATWKLDSVTDAAESETADQPPLVLDLAPLTKGAAVAGSVMVSLVGKTYVDRNGILYRDVDPATGSGLAAGGIDYSAATVTITSWAPGAPAFALLSMLLNPGEVGQTALTHRTAGSPLRPGSYYVQATTEVGDLISATTDQDGEAGAAHIIGAVNQPMGLAILRFGEWVAAAGNEAEPWYDPDLVVGGQIFKPVRVLPSTIRYNCVVQSAVPLDADIVGLDNVRLPIDGRVPIFRPGDTAVIHDTQVMALPNPAVASATYALPRGNLTSVVLEDAEGDKIPTAQYTADLFDGSVTMSAGLDLTGYTQPLKARHRVEDMVQVTDVQVNGDIAFAPAVGHDYPDGAYCSSALLHGDLQAAVTHVFDQATWTNVWQDSLIGSNATATYDDINHPVEVLNESAVSERWRVHFTSSSAFQVIGENLGVIATGTTAGDIGPINSATGDPYFVIRAAGWGAGWAAGNQLRFNTVGANGEIWAVRSVLQGASVAGDSNVRIECRADVD